MNTKRGTFVPGTGTARRKRSAVPSTVERNVWTPNKVIMSRTLEYHKLSAMSPLLATWAASAPWVTEGWILGKIDAFRVLWFRSITAPGEVEAVMFLSQQVIMSLSFPK